MSIINRLKSLFKGDIDKEETDINNDVSNTSNDVEVTSSQMEETIVPEVEDSEKDLTFKKDIEIVEDSSEEIVEEAETIEEVAPEEVEVVEEATPEEPEVVEEVEVVEDEEETTEDVVEEVEENSNDKDKKRDTMTLLTDKELLNDSNRDPDFTAEFIDAGIETVKHCFQCGTCSGGCPSGRRTPYKVRQIVRKCLLGLKEEVISDESLWMCTTCYTCQERCLRSVKIVEIIKKARNIAAHAGYMAKAHKMTGVFVLNTGHAVPINDNVKALRSKIGLPEVPPTTHAYPEALAEVQKLCKITAFDELIGYDEATGGLKE
ncbi:CoB--CoM heterodisulfide reductase subunit C [uncultured Methanobrevibacter sp.]|uniref:CoB--CoM heterodisulfide reductase subunit C n=1 Tax=uncultured Methanobrevibacter sp. TaxID=253161 RepID=UPI0025F0CA0A|nr:CoB--CoM heterodisulfide reductase subunit C [uncultured Methanobrevibacter sp.]MCI6994043.1 CoB--CoM heterodisulfide reductase subunit C [Methanobrevibacter sp.]